MILNDKCLRCLDSYNSFSFPSPKKIYQEQGLLQNHNPPITIQTGFYLIGRGRAQSNPTISLLKLGLLSDKGFALNQCMNERDHGIFLITGRGKNFIGQILIGETKGSTQTVSNKMLSKPTGKIILPLSY